MFGITRVRKLATTNLFILVIRLVQFFFAGVVVGIMSYYIHLQLQAGQSASSPYIFVLVVGVFTMLTQFVYCFHFNHILIFVWDIAVAIGWLISLFWLLNAVSPLSCGWGSFNPFGSDKCSQTRSVLIIQIILAVLWAVTGLIGAWDAYRASKHKTLDVELKV